MQKKARERRGFTSSTVQLHCEHGPDTLAERCACTAPPEEKTADFHPDAATSDRTRRLHAAQAWNARLKRGMSERTAYRALRPLLRRVASPVSLVPSLSSSPSSSSSRFEAVSRSAPWGRTSRTDPSCAHPFGVTAKRTYSALTATFAPRSDFSRPAPPALPPHLQREFDELVRRAQTPAAPGVKLDATPEAEPDTDRRADPEEEMHPDLRRKPKPEFEGDRNPITGEVGGPKIEPLKHGESSPSLRGVTLEESC